VRAAKGKQKAVLLGLGLDNDDGHIRATRGDNFHLLGGSQATHEQMQEKAIKFGEKLKRCGKPLENLDHKEFVDLAQECHMNVPAPTPDKHE
jgi:hypothetical protein